MAVVKIAVAVEPRPGRVKTCSTTTAPTNGGQLDAGDGDDRDEATRRPQHHRPRRATRPCDRANCRNGALRTSRAAAVRVARDEAADTKTIVMSAGEGTHACAAFVHPRAGKPEAAASAGSS